MNLDYIYKVIESVDSNWEQVISTWKDPQAASYDNNYLSVIKDELQAIKDKISDCISEFEIYESEQKNLEATIDDYPENNVC